MRVKLVTLRYSATLGGFDDTPIAELTRDKELCGFREHFFLVNEIPHLACVLTWQDAVVGEADLVLARELCAARARSNRRPRRGAARALQHAARLAREEGPRGGRPALPRLHEPAPDHDGAQRPESPDALGHLDGIGPGKIMRYGTEVLELLREPAAPDAAPTQAAEAGA